MTDLFEDYFRGYARAFDARDPERVTSYFHCPCMMVNANSVAMLDTREAILRSMEGLIRYNEAERYDRSSVSDFHVDRQEANLAMVAVRWHVYRSDGSVLWDWGNSYNLVDYGSGWKILVSISHDAV